ncbi:MAG TPA: PorV/PorQ family protein [Spirochaetota bacterium]|nr:PorV/PorQ family protein [Spirochaetota bacterium]
MKKILFIITSFIFIVAAPYDKAGTSGAQFLKLGKSARAIGMGEAYTPVMYDVDQIYYNPAGVYTYMKYDFSLMYTRYISEINFFNLVGKVKIPGIGDFALAFAGMFMGQIGIDYNTLTETGQQFKNNSIQFTLNYSRIFRDNITAGINLKFLNDSLTDKYNDFNFAADIGGIIDLGLFDPQLEQLCFGLSFLNLGTRSKFAQESFSIPFTFRSGVSYNWRINTKNRLLAVMDFEKVIDRALKFNIGLQYTLINMIKFRFGYKCGDKLNGFKFGIGVHYNNYRLDYSFDYGSLGPNNRVEVGYEFTPPAKTINVKGTVETLYYMGVKAFTDDELERAKKYFKMVLKLVPDHKRSRQRLQEIKDIQQRENMLERFRDSMQEL